MIGLTLDFARKHLLALEPASLRICVLFNKHGRRKAGIDIPVDFFGWDCPNRFIVGYGMDYARMSCLPFIAILLAFMMVFLQNIIVVYHLYVY
jgi:hypoxanthine phosphoribosyltransferase